MSFPGALPASGAASPTDSLAVAGHTALHNAHSNEILAVATKIGIGSSTPTSGVVLRGTGAGTSSWAQVILTSDVTGALPVANGGTGQSSLSGLSFPSATLATPAISNPAITAGGTWTGSPTITSPTLTSFSNSQHDHSNAANGGKLTSTAITSFDNSLTTISNPYKFNVYNNANQTVSTGTIVKLSFNTENFDTNNNFTAGTYTVPVTGFYSFAGAATSNSTGAINVYLFQNGTQIYQGTNIYNGTTNSSSMISVPFIQLTAGNTIDLRVYSDNATIQGDATGRTWFTGGFVCHT